MRGDTTAGLNGAFVELVKKAEQQGDVSTAEIADILHTEKFPIIVQTIGQLEIVNSCFNRLTDLLSELVVELIPSNSLYAPAE